VALGHAGVVLRVTARSWVRKATGLLANFFDRFGPTPPLAGGIGDRQEILVVAGDMADQIGAHVALLPLPVR
jgi:hypothetical protein